MAMVEVGTLRVEYQVGFESTLDFRGLARKDDVERFDKLLKPPNIPAQRDKAMRQRGSVHEIPLYRTREGRPGLTPVGVARLIPNHVRRVWLEDKRNVEVPDL